MYPTTEIRPITPATTCRNILTPPDRRTSELPRHELPTSAFTTPCRGSWIRQRCHTQVKLCRYVWAVSKDFERQSWAERRPRKSLQVWQLVFSTVEASFSRFGTRRSHCNYLDIHQSCYGVCPRTLGAATRSQQSCGRKLCSDVLRRIASRSNPHLMLTSPQGLRG